jgi:signal transduction histidine kinase
VTVDPAGTLDAVPAHTVPAPDDSHRTTDGRPGGSRGSWSLRTRLTALFAVAGLVVVLVSALGAAAFVHLTDVRHVLFVKIDPASLASDQVFEAYLDEETGIRGYLLTRDPAFLQPYTEGAGKERAASARLRAAAAGDSRLLGLAAAAQDAASQWRQDFVVPALMAARTGGTDVAEQQLLGPGKIRFDLVRSRFAALDSALSAERSSSAAALSVASSQLLLALVVGLVLVIVVGIGLARALRSWVTDPLARLGGSVRRVAGGELNRAIEPHGPPEIARLGTDVEAMRLRIVREFEEVTAARGALAESNSELQRSNEELEQFAYIASHDLQEPLRKVTSFVQLLQQRYAGQLDDRADEYIAFAVDGSRRMQELITDLLEFSRVGRTTDAFVPVDTSATARVAVAALAALIDEAGGTVTIGDLPTVPGDPVLLTSLFQNLIGNAVKFRGAAAPVVVVDASREPGRGDWLFTVTDNGIGIEPRFAERVFVIFQRLHARDAFGGTGIGLALCRKIVEFHGGTIWVDTGFRGGARLCFSLPSSGEEGTPWQPVDPRQ